MAYRVDCINKTDRENPWERITHLGGVDDQANSRWKCTQSECINFIEKGLVFYVSRNNHHVKLVVAVSAYGNKYVKTEADDDKQDNLLSLPECA